MQLLIDGAGAIRCIYGEAIELSSLGALKIDRGSHVEPDSSGSWWADLSPALGPKLGPFETRSQALSAEVAWLQVNWLLPVKASS
jgi:hypothetical protein